MNNMGVKLSSSSIRCSKCARLTRVKRLYSNVFGYRGPNGERWNATFCYECEAKLQLLFNLQETCSGFINRLRYHWNENKHAKEKEEALVQ